MIDNKRFIRYKLMLKENRQICKELRELSESIPVLEKLNKSIIKMQNSKQKYLPFKKFDFKDNKTIYLLSDIHFRNKRDYSTLRDVFSVIEQDKSKEITIAFMGDEIDGLLHKNSIKNNYGAIESANRFALIVSEYINKLNKKVNILFVKYSNHTQTRPFSSKREEFLEEDLGVVIETIVKQSTIANKNVK
jgi:hypothetical protein